MGSSVASQIRIDLITQAAQFNAGLREGKQSLGSFREEFERLNKSFDSQKSMASRAKESEAAWETAMRRLGGSAADPLNRRADRLYGADRLPTGFFDASAGPGIPDQALRNQTRWKSMIPWGKSFRYELSREAAETAALVGQKGQSLIRELASAMGPLGGIFSGLPALAANPASWAVGTTAYLLKGGIGNTFEAASDRDRLIRESKETAYRLGQSATDTSKLLGVGFDPTMMSRFQKSIADQTPEQLAAFGKMGLDPNKLGTQPMIESLKEVADAFENRVGNAADRSSIALHLFGRSAGTVIATLHELEGKMGRLGEHEIISATDIERVRSYDHAVKRLSNVTSEFFLEAGRAFGSESGIGTSFERGLAWLGSDQEGRRQIELEKEKDDYRIKHADELEAIRVKQEELNAAEERYLGILKDADKVIQGIRDRAEKFRLGDEGFARDQFSKDLMGKLGLTRDAGGWIQGDRKSRQAYGKEMREYDEAIQDERLRRNQREGEKIDEKNKEAKEKELERKATQERDEADAAYRAQEDRKKAFRSPADRFRDEMKDLIDFRENLTPDEFSRARKNSARRRWAR